MGEMELQSALDKLVDTELIYGRVIAPEATYQFKHALIQDAAYEGLLKTRRRELHLRVAQMLTQHLPSVAEEHPELIARHWTEAGEKERGTPRGAAFRLCIRTLVGVSSEPRSKAERRPTIAVMSQPAQSQREQDPEYGGVYRRLGPEGTTGHQCWSRQGKSKHAVQRIA